MINRTHIGIVMQIWSQLTGMNVMMYYITYIFTMAGLGDSVLLPSSIQYIINVIMTNRERYTPSNGPFSTANWL